MAEDVYLNDLLQIKDLNNYYVRFVKGWGKEVSSNPLDRYYRRPDDPIIHYLWKGEKNTGFKIGTKIIGLIRLTNDSWLLTHVIEITDVKLRSKGEKPLKKVEQPNFWYEYKIVKEFEKFYGRVIINFHNTVQNLIRKPDILKKLVVTELLSVQLADRDFPGYSNVNITWSELELIINRENREWMTALKNQKGVYLITDSCNGKQYVGSAYGINMIWGRWSNYINNGHGGNVELMKLTFDYIKENFQYSILEIADSKASDEYIINREKWWKEALLSKKFGYNSN
ncbi:hypothetical protein E34_1042 [Lactococcus lactis subsp. lactis]|uniref:GIY-YIG nuclease family protein n=1 Tax=Lactococcus lactis TaxID=1358 RepID=UPI00071CE7CD|nr:GIY-YIG nuclease family protein [Lactococcus lactis]KST79091.1 hypothetical protein E34_1042 [Lactococcus lactis subsp. lactis]